MQVNPSDMLLLCDVIRDLCGIAINERKTYLIENRLSEIAESAECKTFGDLARKLSRRDSADLATEVVNAIATGETLFFRDRSPFEVLTHKAIPDIIARKAQSPNTKQIRIWSAACSTGQEPYSIAMTLRDAIPDINNRDVSIVATDISSDSIRYARNGQYRQFEIDRCMTPELLEKHFDPVGKHWKIKDTIRSMVSFQQLNLTQPFLSLGFFDIVFARNVAIYFEKDIRDDLFYRIAESIESNGFLFVGSLESLAPLGEQFMPCTYGNTVFYQPNGQSEAVTV